MCLDRGGILGAGPTWTAPAHPAALESGRHPTRAPRKGKERERCTAASHRGVAPNGCTDTTTPPEG